MQALKFSLLLSILVLLLTACPKQDEPDMSYSITNNCSETIYLFHNNIDSLMTSHYSTQKPLEFINSQETLKSPYYTILFNNGRKLNVLIYKESTLKKYSWQEIQENNIFDKRYVLTLDGLKALNYTIVYNGE